MRRSLVEYFSEQLYTFPKPMKTPILLLALLPLASRAQAPTLVSSQPSRNTVSAPRLGPINLTFSGPVAGAADLQLQSSQWRGYRSGTAGGDGTSTLTFRPQQVFAPGEKVSLTVPATVHSSGAGSQPLASGQVVQFAAAAGPATGTFGTEQRFYTNQSSGVYAPTLADVNNDGRLDLLFSDGQSFPTGVRLQLGDGQGGFGALTTAVAGIEPRQLVMADFNHDGNLDMLVSGYRGVYGMEVSLGNGQGNFTSRPFMPGGGLTTSPQVGDLNADGHPDLVALAYVQTGFSLLVRLGDGQGNFTSLPDMVLPWTGGPASPVLSLVDLNGDGRLDFPYFNPVSSRVETYLGTGLGGFTQATLASAPATAIIGVAELTGDGDLDVLIAQWTLSAAGALVKTVRVWQNGGTGAFTAGPTLSQPGGEITTGDVNNDGTLDMAVVDLPGDNLGPYIGVRLNAALPAAPSFTNFSPSAGGAGSLVTLTGTNFTGATAVLVGGVSITGFTVVNSTTITFIMPFPTPAGLITVLTPAGQATSSRPFLLAAATRASTSVLPVQLFPNPASGEVRLQLPAVGSVHVAFYNSLGQCVRQASPALLDGSAALDLRGLTPGLYTLRLQAGGQFSLQQLVVE